MGSTEESTTSTTSNEFEDLLIMTNVAKELRKIKAIMAMCPPPVNNPSPVQRLSGAQWLHIVLNDLTLCRDNFRMTRQAFLQLHDNLVTFGLTSTRYCTSMESLGMYIWLCAQGSSVRQCRTMWARSLDTISRNTTKVAKVMIRWADSMICPIDVNYGGVCVELEPYEPWFDACIGAIDGTHIPVEVKRQAKVDFIDRNGDVTINVCAIVDMHGLFTYVGAGKAGSCHDMAVLRDCEADEKFPKPPKGRYYLADSGYMQQDGYMTPYPRTRYHRSQFNALPTRNMSREEKFNYIHAKLRNIIERRFGILKERWQILDDGVPFYPREKQCWIIISCFALDNYLWLLEHGSGTRYPLSYWVDLNTNSPTSHLRDLVAAAVWNL
ncbi:unnamed protein product [Urochloa humidicola]